MESSSEDISNYKAEYRSILKNNQNTSPVYFHTPNRKALPCLFASFHWNQLYRSLYLMYHTFPSLQSEKQ